MTRTTEEEYETWARAAEVEARRLGLPISKLTIGPWSRMVLNRAAKELGIQLPGNDNESHDQP